jgi:phage FluMu gp28-like protein
MAPDVEDHSESVYIYLDSIDINALGVCDILTTSQLFDSRDSAEDFCFEREIPHAKILQVRHSDTNFAFGVDFGENAIVNNLGVAVVVSKKVIKNILTNVLHKQPFKKSG